jgi:curved DNA-binding protein
MKNYYRILGVKQYDTVDTIKKAYRKLAIKYKDVQNDNVTKNEAYKEMRSRDINEAWKVLGDKDKRLEYDMKLLKHKPEDLLESAFKRGYNI